jgi:hypothetical protein
VIGDTAALIVNLRTKVVEVTDELPHPESKNLSE